MTALYLDRHGVKVGCARGKLTLKDPGGEEQALPLHTIDHIVVVGHSHFSHDAIAALLRENITVIFSSTRGGYRGMLSGSCGHQIGRRQAHYLAMKSTEQRAVFARALVQAKLRGQARLLRQWKLPACHEIAAALMASHHCSDLAVLRGHEGIAARAFFAGLRQHLEGSPFVFEQRRQHPPSDPVNALLSLTYTLLLNEMELGVAASGLDAAGGFFHEPEDGRPALLMDLIEPLRPLADRLCARLLKHELAPDDFAQEDGTCHMADGRRGILYKAWERLLGEQVAWRGEQTTWRRLIHLQAREVVHWLEGSIPVPKFWHLDDA